MSMTPEQLAQACGEALYSNDNAAKAFGMVVTVCTPGRAVIDMPVRKDMTNGHAICHGGVIFTLADTAFAYACNNTNQNTVASGCNIDFLVPAREGDRLTATAHERSCSGRTGVYDVEVVNQDYTLIALFRGKSYRIKGSLIKTEEENTE
jgi:acyl-CoA thioesterase